MVVGGSKRHFVHSSFSLPGRFWLHFIRRYWRKKPLLIRKPFPQLISSGPETFEALLAESDDYRTANQQTALDFFIENRHLLEHDTRKHLPRKTDLSFAGYAKRLSRELRGSHFALIAQHLQSYHPRLWFRLREFLYPLLDDVGLPGEDSKVSAYLGNYRKTPIGVHPGRSDNFLFVLEGIRKIRVWRAACFREKRQEALGSLDYGAYKKDSILLDGRPGDILYWPAGYWHIGESDGEFSLGVSLALFMNANPATTTVDPVARLLQERLQKFEKTFGDALQDSERMPKKVATLAAKTIRSANKSIEHAVQVAVLNYISASGYTQVPPPAPHMSLAETDVIRGSTGFPIRCERWDRHHIVCSANGHAFTMTADPRLLAMIRELNTGKPVLVGTLTQRYSQVRSRTKYRLTRFALRTLLEKLLSLRAVKRH